MATAEGWVIKRKLVRSERFNALNGDDFTQKIYCLLIACKDSWGMMPADPYTLKGILGPFDETHSPADFEASIIKLAQSGLVYLWKNQESPWLYVVGHDDEHHPSRRKLQPEVPRPELIDINREIRKVLTNSGLTKDLVMIKSATLPRARERGKGLRERGSPRTDLVKTEKTKKKSHPGESRRKELQELSDHHADLFGRQHVRLQMNDHVRRIVKVLESLGLEKCKLIQMGHKELENNPRFMGWPNAYPPVRDGGKPKRTEPDMGWIERHRAAGEAMTNPERQPWV